jgi:tol-pal system-associated acyl-CoA thioesterase
LDTEVIEPPPRIFSGIPLPIVVVVVALLGGSCDRSLMTEPTQEEPYRLDIRIYYEDTDVGGYVYHANYLKYFERAREHIIGPETLERVLREDGFGYVVPELSMNFKQGARLGDVLEIRTWAKRTSAYRLVFDQRAYRKADDSLMVSAEIHLVCIDAAGRLVAIPDSLMPESVG